MTPQDLSDIIEQHTKETGRRPPIRVKDSIREFPFKLPTNAYGAVVDGKIPINAAAHKTKADVVATLRHEYTHFGLLAAYGEQKMFDVMQSLYGGSTRVKQAVTEWLVVDSTAASLPKNPASLNDATNVVTEALKQLSKPPRVHVVPTVAGLPAVAKAKVTAAGLLFRGEIYVVAGAHATELDVLNTIWHELLHYGVRAFMNKEPDPQRSAAASAKNSASSLGFSASFCMHISRLVSTLGWGLSPLSSSHAIRLSIAEMQLIAHSIESKGGLRWKGGMSYLSFMFRKYQMCHSAAYFLRLL
jgi:hypothetical protein